MTTLDATRDAVRTYRTVNPATGEIVREYATVTDEGAEELLARAHASFLEWRAIPVAERVARYRRFAELCTTRIDDLARQTSEEMGKPLGQALAEAAMVPEMFRYYADRAEDLLADEIVEVPGLSRAVVRREPIGVVLGIEPWNGPLYQAMRATAPNLMLGNTVLLKPAEISAASTLMFDELFREAGFPAGAFQTALVSVEQVAAYIADPRVRAVTLTGSDRAGSAIGEQAGRHVKPVVLELGGSDAFIVADSADVDAAIATAVTCRLLITGQACISPKRIILTEAVADRFIAGFLEQLRVQTLGDPFDPATTVGPMSSTAAADLLQAQYQDAIDKGATVLLAGGRVDRPGAFFAPAVITDITPEMRVYTEEAFGPLAMIYRVPDADAAVELANVTPYGLGGTVFAQDHAEADSIARRIDTGGVGINTFLGARIELPFGGTKRSGVGRELGRMGMDPFANIKTYGRA